ncbi:hypothetical protein NQ318_013933 [Aromia moschata]|uniref:Uncharacterized protein n=1 Tax=Aromia moschata TaxID=1265417 RepID=A0AAV8ZBD6_9CUCU|nr:hypothetical protein NQ318_013933 [Aromia moschata]
MKAFRNLISKFERTGSVIDLLISGRAGDQKFFRKIKAQPITNSLAIAHAISHTLYNITLVLELRRTLDFVIAGLRSAIRCPINVKAAVWPATAAVVPAGVSHGLSLTLTGPPEEPVRQKTASRRMSPPRRSLPRDNGQEDFLPLCGRSDLPTRRLADRATVQLFFRTEYIRHSERIEVYNDEERSRRADPRPYQIKRNQPRERGSSVRKRALACASPFVPIVVAGPVRMGWGGPYRPRKECPRINTGTDFRKSHSESTHESPLSGLRPSGAGPCFKFIVVVKFLCGSATREVRRSAPKKIGWWTSRLALRDNGV